MKRRKTKKVKMVRVLGETVRKGGVRYRYLLAERRNFLRRQRDPNSSYYGVPISELLKSNRRRGLRKNAPRLNMYTQGEKYIGTIEIPKPNGDYDVWEIVRRGRVFVIGTATNSGLLSDYYFKMEQGESEQRALQEINADLEVLATDGPSYMSRVKKIPSRKIEVSRQRAERRRNLQGNRRHRRGLRRNPSESPSDYYYKLLRAGVPMDSHESDLYVKDTPTARAILADWPFGRLGRFKNNINGEIYIDIPFAYAPYWEKKVRR